jgi:hypothetical protein
MKIYVQWATKTAKDWIETDSSLWSTLARKTQPVGGESIDETPGWLSQLNIQGNVIQGFDHYHLKDNPDGSITMTIWNDDPVEWAGKEYAQRWIIHPVEPDLSIPGNPPNTRIFQTWYRQEIPANASEYYRVSFLNWALFVSPPAAEVIHGIWLSDVNWRKHEQIASFHKYQEWTSAG